MMERVRTCICLVTSLVVAGCSAYAATAPLSGHQKIETLLAAGYEVKAGEFGGGVIDVFLQKGQSLY
jgi:hypothetical protein